MEVCGLGREPAYVRIRNWRHCSEWAGCESRCRREARAWERGRVEGWAGTQLPEAWGASQRFGVTSGLLTLRQAALVGLFGVMFAALRGPGLEWANWVMTFWGQGERVSSRTEVPWRGSRFRGTPDLGRAPGVHTHTHTEESAMRRCTWQGWMSAAEEGRLG